MFETKILTKLKEKLESYNTEKKVKIVCYLLTDALAWSRPITKFFYDVPQTTASGTVLLF